MKRVVITGMGAVTPLGINLQQTWKALLRGESGIKKIACSPNFKCQIGGTIPAQFDYKKYQMHLKPDRIMGITNSICQEALKDSGIDMDRCSISKNKFGVHLDSSYVMLDDQSRMLQNTEDQLQYIQKEVTLMSELIANQYDLKGYIGSSQVQSFSGLNQIGTAYRQIKHGLMDAFIAGSVDINVGYFGQIMMENMNILNISHNENPEKSLMPFDVQRGGTVCADGGGVLILESLDSARNRNARIYAEIVGFSNTCESQLTLSRPNPYVKGIIKSILHSLQEAGLDNTKIDVLFAHAKSTIVHDEQEAKAIRFVLGTPWDKLTSMSIKSIYEQGIKTLNTDLLKKTLISTQKGNIGHNMVASGAIETTLAVQQLANNVVLKILNLQQPCDTDLSFVKGDNIEKQLNVAVKTTVGIGNQVDSLVLKKYIN